MIKQLTLENEILLRRFLCDVDPELALHEHVKNYYLSPTDQFGSLGVFDNEHLVGVCFYSKFNSWSYIHRYIGDMIYFENIVEKFPGNLQIFLHDFQKVEIQLPQFKQIMEVWPGKTLDHEAWSGVFWRSTPRYNGIVIQRELND